VKRAILLLAGVLILSQCLRADTTQTWDITASDNCNDCQHPPFFLAATLTTKLVPGTFDWTAYDDLIYGPEPVPIAITGTYNGLPVMLVAPPPDRYGLPDSFLYYGRPEQIWFEAGGVTHNLEDDLDKILLDVVPINWTIVETTGVPEPSAITLLRIGLAAMLCLFGKLKIHPANR
jgi:hypothetical protein